MTASVTQLKQARRQREVSREDRELAKINVGPAELKQLRNLHSYLGSKELAAAIGISQDALRRVMAGLIDSSKIKIKRAVAAFFAASR